MTQKLENPVNDFECFGYSATLFDDDVSAHEIEKRLIPLSAEHFDVSVDRFDVRLLLVNYGRSALETSETDDDNMPGDNADTFLNEERYKDLYQHSSSDQKGIGEVLTTSHDVWRLQTQTTPTAQHLAECKSLEDDDTESDTLRLMDEAAAKLPGIFIPPIPGLSQILKNNELRNIVWPSCIAEYLIIEYTSRFVIQEGDQIEFRLKLLPDNNNFVFLDPNHPLYPLYIFLKRSKFSLYDYGRDLIPKELLCIFSDSQNDASNVDGQSSADEIPTHAKDSSQSTSHTVTSPAGTSTKILGKNHRITSMPQNSSVNYRLDPTGLADPASSASSSSSLKSKNKKSEELDKIIGDIRRIKSDHDFAKSHGNTHKVESSPSFNSLTSHSSSDSKKSTSHKKLKSDIIETSASGLNLRDKNVSQSSKSDSHDSSSSKPQFDFPIVCWESPPAALALTEEQSRIIQEIGYELLRRSDETYLKTCLEELTHACQSAKDFYSFLCPRSVTHLYFCHVIKSVADWKQRCLLSFQNIKDKCDSIFRPLNHSLHPMVEKYIHHLRRLSRSKRDETWSLPDESRPRKSAKTKDLTAVTSPHNKASETKSTEKKTVVDNVGKSPKDSKNEVKEMRRKRTLELLGKKQS